MKNMKFFLSIFYLLLVTNCKSQNIKKMLIPVISNESEMLIREEFSNSNKANSKNLKQTSDKSITNKEDLLEVRNGKGEILISFSKSDKTKSFSGYDYSLNPIIGIYKQFHPNGVIKQKGLFCWFGFKIGVWYEFDSNGSLISSEDFEKSYNFNYEQLFMYCQNHNIPLEKKTSGSRTKIYKFFLKDLDLHVWSIIYPDYDKRVEKVIMLDGNDGKVVKEFEQSLPE